MQFYTVSVKTLSFHFISDPDPLRQKVPDPTGSRSTILDRTVSNFGVIHNLPIFLLFPGPNILPRFAMYSDLEGSWSLLYSGKGKNG